MEAILSLISNFAARSLIAISLFASTAATAETIVVRSTGPSAKSYPPGKSLADNAKLLLKAGDTLTILDGRGTRVLKGPGNFSTTVAARTATDSTLNQLVRNTGTRQARTGATRGASSSLTNLWHVDTSKSGTMCIADPTAIPFWRAGKEQPATLTLVRLRDNKSFELAFRAGQEVKTWQPGDVPLVDGDQFRLSGDALASPTQLRFVVMGPNAAGIEATASTLLSKGCSMQFDRLVALVESVSPPSDEDQPIG